MGDYEFITVERQDRLTIITINRPEVRNALHRPAHLELDAAFNDFAADPDAWIAILTGAGDLAFSAGNDLKYQAAGGDRTPVASGFAGITARFDLDKPVIAAVNGLAMGGGFETALACDLLIAEEHAIFSLPEPRVGLAAVAGGLVRLPRMIPQKQAMGMILTSRRVSAEEGMKMGFVNEVAPKGQSVEAAKRWAEEILIGSPMSIRASKQIAYRSLGEATVEEAYKNQKEYPGFKALLESEDFVEGPKAFSEKRKPNWKGR